MTRLTTLFYLIVISTAVLAQSPVPCYEVDFTDDSFSPLTNYCAIKFENAIVNGSNDGSTDYDAAKRIRMGSDFTVSSSNGSSKFEIIEREDALDLVWIEPTESYVVPRYEKLEIGVALPDSLMQLVSSYMETGEGVNPFDPDQLDVYAIFERRDANGDWTFDRVTNGFYFEDFELNYELESIPSWGLWDWLPVATSFPFRIRFAPTQIAEHRCQVFIAWNGSQMESSPFNFWVSSSDNPGYVRVASNNRYLEYPDNSLFFPVGQNLSPNERMARAFYSDGNYTLARCSGLFPGGDARSMVSALGYGLSQWSGTRRYAPVIYHEMQCYMEKCKDAGMNSFRYISWPWSTDVEYEKLNDYSTAMKGAWEFDRILEKAKELGLKIEWNMQLHNPFEMDPSYNTDQWDWRKDHKNDSTCMPIPDATNAGYAYGLPVSEGGLGLEHAKDFFTSEVAKANYKKKLRYNLARWGYSSDIFLIELFSEINQAARDLCPSGYWPYWEENSFRQNIHEWQYEMAEYLKDDLLCKQLLASSYTSGTYGTHPERSPNFIENCDDIDVDQTYFNNPHLDVICESYYNDATEDIIHRPQRIRCFEKPYIYSEIGAGDAHAGCGEPAAALRRVLLSPFTQAAGVGNNWHYQYILNDSAWNVLSNIDAFFDGINLNVGEWVAHGRVWSDITSVVDSIISIELDPSESKPYELGGLILTNQVDSVSKRRIGALVNQYWNEATVGLCDPDSVVHGYGLWPVSFADSLGFRELDLCELQFDDFSLDGFTPSRAYHFRFYNPFNGSYLELDAGSDTLTVYSDTAGVVVFDSSALCDIHLTLEMPIVYFEAFDTALPGVKSLQLNTTENLMVDFFGEDVENITVETHLNGPDRLTYRSIRYTAYTVNGRVIAENVVSTASFTQSVASGVYILVPNTPSEGYKPIKLCVTN